MNYWYILHFIGGLSLLCFACSCLNIVPDRTSRADSERYDPQAAPNFAIRRSIHRSHHSLNGSRSKCRNLYLYLETDGKPCMSPALPSTRLHFRNSLHRNPQTIAGIRLLLRLRITGALTDSELRGPHSRSYCLLHIDAKLMSRRMQQSLRSGSAVAALLYRNLALTKRRRLVG